jgi:adenosylmethionine-8-amino-7-oxononanoate aminotransferase
VTGARGVLVTGTDTGVGKTLVAAGIVRALRRRGIDTGVMKAAATGVPPDDDADLLRAAAECDDPPELVSPLRLRDPLAPAVAADREGRVPDPAVIRRAFEALAVRHAFTVVEGTGGLLVPLAWGFTVADLARDLGLPLLVVARAGLGTLNHAALTVEAARARGIPVLGVVLNRAEEGPAGLAEETNPAALERLAGVRVLGTVPRVPADRARDPDALADAIESAVDLGPLLEEATWPSRAEIERWKRIDREHVWHPFTQMQEWTDPVVIVRGEGPYLFDAEGRRYVDGVSSLWVTVHGHRTPEIDAAVASQLGRVAHSTLLGLSNVPSIELAGRLVERAPRGLTRVFYSDSGSTAVEVALKMAFQHQRRRGEERRTKFAFFEGGYHGDTLGAVSVGGIDLFHRLFRPLLFDSHRVPAPRCYRCPVGKTFPTCGIDCLRTFEEVLREHGGEIAAVIVEPAMQGAAGMIPQPEGWLTRVAAGTREAGALLIADEVAVGLGRTGRWFAVEHEGVRPDLLAVAKGLSGGYLPLAATLATEEVFASFLGRYEEMRTFFHGHTYTGNPLACAAAIANLDKMARERTVEEAARKGEILGRLLEPLRSLPPVGDVRRRGLMAGVELVSDRAAREPFPPEARAGARVCEEARRRGVLLRPLGNVVVLMPPLGAPDGVLGEIVEVLAASIRAAFPEETR